MYQDKKFITYPEPDDEKPNKKTEFSSIVDRLSFIYNITFLPLELFYTSFSVTHTVRLTTDPCVQIRTFG